MTFLILVISHPFLLWMNVVLTIKISLQKSFDLYITGKVEWCLKESWMGHILVFIRNRWAFATDLIKADYKRSGSDVSTPKICTRPGPNPIQIHLHWTYSLFSEKEKRNREQKREQSRSNHFKSALLFRHLHLSF